MKGTNISQVLILWFALNLSWKWCNWGKNKSDDGARGQTVPLGTGEFNFIRLFLCVFHLLVCLFSSGSLAGQDVVVFDEAIIVFLRGSRRTLGIDMLTSLHDKFHLQAWEQRQKKSGPWPLFKVSPKLTAWWLKPEAMMLRCSCWHWLMNLNCVGKCSLTEM